MKIKELRQQSKKELLDLLREKKSENVNARMSVVGGNVKSVKQLVESKKTIARINTILSEQQQ